MRVHRTPFRVRLALALFAGGFPGLTLVQAWRASAEPPAKPNSAWTLDEAMAQLAVHPRDPYLQYVALQLARRENRLEATEGRVAQAVNPGIDSAQGRRERAAQRRDRVDLFSIFSGALAVQESLQLDSMRGGAGPAEEVGAEVEVGTLAGPTVKSHPWEQMLAGRKPDVGTLARSVPEDFYLVEFRSTAKMLDLLDNGDLWATHLFSQGAHEARTQQVGERVRQQLALETNRLLRPVYDAVVEEMAVTGSDLFAAEGSDVTVLFRARQPDLLRSRLDGFLDAAARAHPDAKRTEGKYAGVDYVHLAAPERAVHVYSAWPEPNLHVRSNSEAAFFRVLEAVKGKDADGKAVRRLGDTAEFAYIRTLMPREAREEDGFVYLSDPFIRRLVGPRLKLTERRRTLCYNHLRMIGHASLLFRTEHGRAPKSLAELAEARCCPGPFNEGELTCPDGGKYTLSADGSQGVCAHHGHAQNLVPCLETPVTKVGNQEVTEYKSFLDEYNQYWRMYFDPIALRVRVTPKRYRLETVVLPLIDNSIYTGLATALKGKPEPLDALPVPRRDIFTVNARYNKEELLAALAPPGEEPAAAGPKAGGAPRARSVLQATNDLKQIGLAFHMYHDANGTLPTPDGRGKGDKPLLSWRVHLLPYLEQEALYKEFKLDESWDSEHNKKLIVKIPAVFRGPDAKLAKEGKTNYLAAVGPGLFFKSPGKAARMADILDGTSNTILAVEAADDRAVVWTKPDDLSVDPKDPKKGLVRPGQDGFLALMGDGSVKYLKADIPAATLNALFTRAGGEAVALGPGDERGAGPGPDFRLGWLGDLGVSPEEARRSLYRLLKDGLGNQVGLHVYDAPQLFDFDLPQFLGLIFGTLNRGGRGAPGPLGPGELAFGFLATSLTSPAYVSLPVKDAAVVDDFLDQLDKILPPLARQRENFGGFLRFEQDYYKTKLSGGVTARAYGFRVGPVKWRFFWARVGGGLYVASKPYILEDLEAAEVARATEPAAADPDATGHAVVRLRPKNWKKVLADYRLGWAENNREACLNNLGPLSSVGRAAAASGQKEGGALPRDARALAERLYAVRFFCPEGGRYAWTADGKACSCSVHGTAQVPRQQAAPNEASGLGKLLEEFGGLTATLTFLEDGLHAVVVVERK